MPTNTMMVVTANANVGTISARVLGKLKCNVMSAYGGGSGRPQDLPRNQIAGAG
jgi:hypothetical protein